jgi:hypothetical protein
LLRGRRAAWADEDYLGARELGMHVSAADFVQHRRAREPGEPVRRARERFQQRIEGDLMIADRARGRDPVLPRRAAVSDASGREGDPTHPGCVARRRSAFGSARLAS